MIPTEALKQVKRIITHRDCADGTAAAMIAADAIPDAEVVAVAYGPERDALEPGPADLFVDMTPPPAKVDAFVAAGAIVLDHHKGACELVARFGERGIYADADDEPGISGAMLAFREVWLRARPTGIEETRFVSCFAKLAGIRDCWLRTSDYWVAACEQAEVLTFYPLHYWLKTGRVPYVTDAEGLLGQKLFAHRLRRARDIAERGCLRLGATAIFNDAPKPDSRISDVAEALREVDPVVKLVVGFYYSLQCGQPVLEFHLRSTPGAELTARQIAVANGGGGHDHAAGFVCSSCQDSRWHDGSPIELFRQALWTARAVSP